MEKKRNSIQDRRLWLLMMFWIFPAILFLDACVQSKPISADEIDKRVSNDRVLLLMRIVAGAENKTFEPFPSGLADDNVGIAIADVEPDAIMRQVQSMKFFSDQSRRQGWVAIFVEPGDKYISFLPPRTADAFSYFMNFQRAPKIKAKIPLSADIVYGGTIAFESEIGTRLFGGEYIKQFKLADIRDEFALAKELVDQKAPNFNLIKISLLEDAR